VLRLRIGLIMRLLGIFTSTPRLEDSPEGATQDMLLDDIGDFFNSPGISTFAIQAALRLSASKS